MLTPSAAPAASNLERKNRSRTIPSATKAISGHGLVFERDLGDARAKTGGQEGADIGAGTASLCQVRDDFAGERGEQDAAAEMPARIEDVGNRGRGTDHRQQIVGGRTQPRPRLAKWNLRERRNQLVRGAR